MNICLLNATQNGSTGSIVKVLANYFNNNGHNVLCAFGKKTQDWEDINCFFTVKNKFRKYLNKLEARFDGRDGFVNSFNTKKLIKQLEIFKPDIIHLHNMHGEWISFSLIIKFANKNNIPVVMTVHDCWIETGRCAYYTFIGCNRYLNGCGHCSHRLNYPKLYFFDRSKYFYKLKRKSISTIRMYFSPSHWLANEIKNAGIKTDIKVVGNPYDDKIFYPILKKNGNHQKTIGFCSYVWNESKGLSMAQQIAEHYLKKGYKIIFIGLAQDDDRLPKGAIGIAKTNNRHELADLYRLFDVFVNPTKQDNFPTVNMEAMACGIPVVVARVGGAYEILTDEWTNGIVENYEFCQFIYKIDFLLSNAYKTIPSSFFEYKFEPFSKNTLKYYNDLLSNKL